MGQYPVAALADEIEAGNLRALVVVGGNPLVAFPDHQRIVAALDALEVLAVADVVDADTTGIATHVMACTGQLERADLNLAPTQPALYGQHTPALLAPGADRRPLWWFAGQLARRLGFDAVPGDPDDLSDDDVIALSCPRPVVTLDALRAEPLGVTADSTFGWLLERSTRDPWDLAPAPVVQRLTELAPPPELALLPRRQLRHLNSILRDVPAPGGRVDEAVISVHPDEAAAAGLLDGAWARVTTEHGSVEGPLHIDTTLPPGAVSVPHGFRHLNVAELTSGRPGGVEPLSGMVLQSGLAVTLTAGTPTAVTPTAGTPTG
jgi:anaerobic selenocysteine-containing dehydrogenase